MNPIDKSEVVNGSVWEADLPMCWTVMVQYITGDDWVILAASCPDVFGYGAPFIAHHSPSGKVIRTHGDVYDWLVLNRCKRLNATVRVVESEKRNP